MVAASLWAHKLRSALTLLGVIIGTSVVVMVGAVLTGLAQRVAAYTERTAPNAVYFTKGDRIGPSFSRPSAEERQRKDLTYEDAVAAAALPAPLAVSPQKIRGSYGPAADPPKLSARGREAINPLILGVWENFPDIVSVRVERGRFFIAEERERRTQVAVIGAGVANQLFEQADPLDQEVRIDGRVFRIIGVLGGTAGEGVLGSDELDERIVYIPFETADKLYPDVTDVALVARAPQGRVDEVIDEIATLLRTRRNVPASAPNNFGINRAEQVFDAVNQIIAGLAAIVLPIALAGQVIGGVGVMNIMLVSVKERSAEIGIRRALGARRRDVRNQFLLEAVTLTGAGGLIGILLGFGFAFLAGMWPALRAARLDPVAAMRGD